VGLKRKEGGGRGSTGEMCKKKKKGIRGKRGGRRVKKVSLDKGGCIWKWVGFWGGGYGRSGGPGVEGVGCKKGWRGKCSLECRGGEENRGSAMASLIFTGKNVWSSEIKLTDYVQKKRYC